MTITVASPAQGGGTIADATSPVTRVLPNAVSVGQLVVVVCSADGVGTFVAGDCTKSAGTSTIGTVALDKTINQTTDQHVGIWSFLVTGAGTLTVAVATGGAFSVLGVQVFNGTWSATAATRLEGTNAAVGTTSTTPTSGNVTSAGAALFVGGLAVGNSANVTLTQDSNFTSIFESPDGTAHEVGESIYRIVSTGTTDDANWTIGAAPTRTATALAVYKEVVVGGGTLVAAQGSYSLTGQTVTLTKSGAAKVLTAAQGTYSFTGQTSPLVRGRKLSPPQGVYTVLGSDAKVDLVIAAVKGTYTLTGQTAGGGKTGNATVQAGQGSYALSGQTVTLIRGRVLVAVQGSYSVSGTSAAFQTSMPTEGGVYSLSGQVANLLWSGVGSKTLPAAQGAYSLSGQSVVLRYAKGIGAGQGGYVLSGQPVALLYSGQPGLPDTGRYLKKKVFAVSPSGKVKWVDYIPVHQHPEVLPQNADRYNDNGAITVQVLSSVTGLTAWRDYTPIVDVGSGGRWRFDSNGYIAIVPVF